MAEKEYITLDEASQLYSIAEGTLRGWIKRSPHDGTPPLEAFKPGKKILVKKSTLENYIKKFKAA